MSITDSAIENLADAFVQLSNGSVSPLECRILYVEGLKSIAKMANAELMCEMQLDFTKATTPPLRNQH